MWKCLLYNNSIRCTPRKRCYFCPLNTNGIKYIIMVFGVNILNVDEIVLFIDAAKCLHCRVVCIAFHGIIIKRHFRTLKVYACARVCVCVCVCACVRVCVRACVRACV